MRYTERGVATVWGPAAWRNNIRLQSTKTKVFPLWESITSTSEKTKKVSLTCKSRMTTPECAGQVPSKGSDAFATNFILGVLDEVGYRRLILKSDNENAIKALKSAVKAAAKVEVVLEESKTGDHQSNGLAEVAVRESKRQCRAMKSALEEKMGKPIDERHPILSWLARHGNFLMSRYRLGQDGRTAYEKLKGKKWKRAMVTFGEKVWFRPLKSYTAGESDLAQQLKVGRYVGTHGRNGDVLIMTPDGVWKGGSVKRTPLESRWDDEDFAKLKGAPWNLRPKAVEDVDSLPVRIELPPAEGRLTPEAITRDGGPRNLYVTRKDVDGKYTLGCPGCIAIQVDLPARSHNAECRAAVEKRLLETEEGKARVEKARKRKSEVVEAEEKTALADVPDEAEEMHGPSAIGDPALERVDPVGQPAPTTKRSSEEGDPSKAEKKVKADTPRGLKRKDSGIERLEEESTVPKIPPGSSTDGSGPKPKDESSTSVLEIVSVLEEHMFTRLESKKEVLEIGQLLCSMGISKPDVAEIYNPERFVSRANAFGLRPGFAIDLSLTKENGEHWDLSTEKDQRALKALLKDERPLFLVGSPPCGPFSPLQNLSKHKRTAEENEAILAEGRKHLEVAVDSYLEQHRNGRYFLHEHPKPSASWEEECMKKLQALPGVSTVQAPMCKWELTAEDGQGIGYVRKETQWVTDSREVAEAIAGKCDGRHRHVQLINGRARQAQIYPPKLVSAILKGIKKELHNIGELDMLSELVAGPCPDDTSNEQTEEFFDPDQMASGEYYDAITGIKLDPVQVLKAREEEMQWVRKQELWDVVDETLCWQETNRPPISLKWVDRNKGDQSHPNYRSRIVVREVKKASKPLAEFESFSAMPPLEALKTLCSLMASKRVSKRNKPYKLMLIDISRAHFYGLAKRRVFCTLPEGEEQAGKCALLRKSMYGTLDAANIWQSTYVSLLKECGIRQCVGWPALFYHPEQDLRFLVHGDDFVALGDQEALTFLEEKLKTKFEYRVDGLIGPDPSDGTSMNVLNRVIGFNKSDGTVSYEADPRHAEHIIRELKLEGCKPVSAPAEKQKQGDVIASEELPALDATEASRYRSLTMRAAYLSGDRADLSEAVKTLARHMQSPTAYSWGKLKRLGRYLAGKPRVVQYFRQQKMFNTIRVYCDSDHAGDLKTRRSTTGIVCVLGGHSIKHSSNLQSTVSLSSGESEFYALVKAGAVGLGVKAMLEEWEIPTRLVLLSDSSAARGIVSRKGLGKTRHVQTRYLWIQEKVQTKELSIEAVGTEQNLADLCTKPLAGETCWKHMQRMNQVAADGRNTRAKQLEWKLSISKRY